MLSLASMAGSVLSGRVAVVLGAALALGVVQPTWSRLLRMGQSVRLTVPIGHPGEDRSLRSHRARQAGVELDVAEAAAEPWDRKP